MQSWRDTDLIDFDPSYTTQLGKIDIQESVLKKCEKQLFSQITLQNPVFNF